MSFGIQHLPRQPGHDLHRVGAAHADGACPRPPALGVCESVPMISSPGEGVVLQHHLVDDARARAPEADAVLRAAERRKS